MSLCPLDKSCVGFMRIVYGSRQLKNPLLAVSATIHAMVEIHGDRDGFSVVMNPSVFVLLWLLRNEFLDIRLFVHLASSASVVCCWRGLLCPSMMGITPPVVATCSPASERNC